MSAEMLRRAAALMRERAEAASPGPWEPTANHFGVAANAGSGPWVVERVALGYELTRANISHIASWHPAVALAVADWLDMAGADIWAHGPLCECGTGCDACDDNLWEPHARHALAVARAYLGESS